MDHCNSLVGKSLTNLSFAVQQLNESLKAYPERQSDKKPLALSTYTLNVSGHFSRTILALYRAQDRQSSCLHGVSSIAGTPIVMTRPKHLIKYKTDTKWLALQELGRDMSNWESYSIDIGAKLHCQITELVLFVDKVIPQLTGTQKPQTGKLDVFTRLYQQTPARYKVNSKVPQGNGSLRPISTSKVTMLKRLFTPEEGSPSGPPKRTGRKPLVLSNTIKSLCKQLTAHGPDLVVKTRNTQFPQTKRQLF